MRAYLLLGVAALTLGACKLDRDPGPAADQAQLTAGAPFEIGLAPAFGALPPAEPMPVYYAPEPVAYDYWNDAYDMNQTYYNQPPTYFNYAGATPLVWGQPQQQSLGGSLTNMVISRIVEALVGGGQREYFYQPGADYPYFIRDPQYAYAVDDGRLVALYDPYGRLLPEPMLIQQAPVASRYFLRADDLRDAALVAAMQPLAPEVWTRQRAVWVDQLDDNDGWRSTWIPGASRSPVAVRRLAEVRARKEDRDAVHARWKAELAATRPTDKGPKLARIDRGDDRGARKADKGHDARPMKKAEAPKGAAKKADARRDDDRPKADKRAGNDKPRAVRTAEASKGPAKKADAKGGKGKDKGDHGKGGGKNG